MIFFGVFSSCFVGEANSFEKRGGVLVRSAAVRCVWRGRGIVDLVGGD